ncbi:MAG: hypothetical protein GY750_02380 [Lentisphaerae bacterium]|nr:hypothetical protein [Lentisphaerota bacterium]MCP4100268.1 hypothetical protein [Lentisphaerota bacterium]
MEKRIFELEGKIAELGNAVDIIGEAGNRRDRNFWRHAATRRQLNHLIDVISNKYAELWERINKLEAASEKKECPIPNTECPRLKER